MSYITSLINQYKRSQERMSRTANVGPSEAHEYWREQYLAARTLLADAIPGEIGRLDGILVAIEAERLVETMTE